jgi:hypothetical protein
VTTYDHDLNPFAHTHTITSHDSETLCLYLLNFANVSPKRDVAVVVDIRLARPARTLRGFPLVGGRKRDREINHEGLGADICNGLKLKKSECADFSPCSLFNDLSGAPALSAAKQSLRTAVERLKRLERWNCWNDWNRPQLRMSRVFSGKRTFPIDEERDTRPDRK